MIETSPRQAHTLLVRMDKLGDLVLSLPSDSHPALRGQNIHWAITKGLEFVAEQSIPKRKFTSFSKKFSPVNFFRFVFWLKQLNPFHIVLLHAPWWVSMASWWAGVPVRIGPLSQWHSYLFMNFGVRQKRSLSTQHESDYNFDLIDKGFVQVGLKGSHNLEKVKESFLKLIAPNPNGTLQQHRLKSQSYVVLHPGMGGSAFNWPSESYLEVARLLNGEVPIVVTGTLQDKKYLDPIEEELKSLPQVKWLVGELSAHELLNVLSQARCVLAPSTGVIHLAASLGVPVIGIYSPKRQEHPRRWGPKGPCVEVFFPATSTDQQLRPDVMTEIKVKDVYESLKNYL